MYRLRVYDAGGGDCLALRNGRRTEFIFDTGLKGSADFERHRGFAHALQQASGKGGAPVVIISHVDADHIGGLIAWVEHLIRKCHGDWREAGRAARSQVSQVWCNVPIPDLALARAFDVPGFLVPPVDNPNQGQQPDSAMPIPQILEHELDSVAQLVDLWPSTKRDDRPSPSEVSQAIDSLQTWLSTWETDSPAREHLFETLMSAFPEERDFIQALREGRGVRFGNGRVVVEFSLFHPSGTMEIYIDFETEPSLADDELDDEPGNRNRSFARHRSWIFEGTRRETKGHSRILVIRIHDMTTATSAVITALDDARTPGDAVEVILNYVAKEKGLSHRERDRLVIVRALFGRLPVAGWKDRLGLFTALRMLGIPVRGIGPKGYLGEGVSPPHGVAPKPVFLSPDRDALRRLAERWSEYESRLQVSVPAEASLLLAFAADDSFAWKPDRSPTNLSSLSVWFEKIGCTAVALTGDGLHGQLMDALQRTKPNKKAGRLVYQIPHHGSRHNTNVREADHPADVLNLPVERVTCLTTGGHLGKHRLSRPHRQVVRFFARDRRVVRTREEMRRRGQPYLDINLG